MYPIDYDDFFVPGVPYGVKFGNREDNWVRKIIRFGYAPGNVFVCPSAGPELSNHTEALRKIPSGSTDSFTGYGPDCPNIGYNYFFCGTNRAKYTGGGDVTPAKVGTFEKPSHSIMCADSANQDMAPKAHLIFYRAISTSEYGYGYLNPVHIASANILKMDGSVATLKSTTTGATGMNHLHASVALPAYTSGNMWTRGDRVPW